MERISSKFVHILLLSEHLRSRLHAERNPEMIKHRRYHLRMYQCCFVGKDLVDWLVKHGEACNRFAAVQCMCVLQESNLLHHVCDDHVFKDEMLFYRFRLDDNTLPITRDIELVLKGYDISQRIKSDDVNIVKNQECEDYVYRSCFVGSALVDWMVEVHATNDRFEAIMLGRELLELGLIKHVTDDHHFKDDSNLHFQFVIDKIISKKLLDALALLNCSGLTIAPAGSPLMTRKTLASNKKNAVPPIAMPKRSVPVPLNGRYVYSPESPEISPTNSSPDNASPRPVIVREITVDELLDSTGPYAMKTIRIMSDSVGFGFVVRGQEPVYVQTVDPEGPAAAAGLRVRMFIHSVNGKDVLHWSHKDVAKEIMRGQNVVDLVVMTHFRGS